jgi:hypothetical protein
MHRQCFSPSTLYVADWGRNEINVLASNCFLLNALTVISPCLEAVKTAPSAHATPHRSKSFFLNFQVLTKLIHVRPYFQHIILSGQNRASWSSVVGFNLTKMQAICQIPSGLKVKFRKSAPDLCLTSDKAPLKFLPPSPVPVKKYY